jgi:hypothetical protein
MLKNCRKARWAVGSTVPREGWINKETGALREGWTNQETGARKEGWTNQETGARETTRIMKPAGMAAGKRTLGKCVMAMAIGEHLWTILTRASGRTGCPK